jgi:preprotein translocase subunit SecB
MKLTIAQIILEEADFRHKGDLFAQSPANPPPPSGVEIGIELRKSDDLSTAIVRLRVNSDPEEGYAFRVVYTVIFGVSLDEEPTPDDIDKRLMVTGANTVFPFVRDLVASLTMRGRFGPTWLAPTNFSAIVAAKNPTPEAEVVGAP